MTPEQRQELRDFLAREVLGWTYPEPPIDTSGFGTIWKHNFDKSNPGFVHQCGHFISEKEWNDSQYYFKDRERIRKKDTWQPDSEDVPASQILGVIEVMRGRGWKAMIDITDRFYATFYQEIPPTMTAKADGEADDLLTAICLAAKAAVEGEK